MYNLCACGHVGLPYCSMKTLVEQQRCSARSHFVGSKPKLNDTVHCAVTAKLFCAYVAMYRASNQYMCSDR